MSGVCEFNEFVRCNTPVTSLRAYDKLNEIITSHHIKYGCVRDYKNLISLRSDLRAFLDHSKEMKEKHA